MGRLGRELDHVPGPPGRWWFGNATQLARDPLNVISNIALQYGGTDFIRTTRHTALHSHAHARARARARGMHYN